MADHILEKKSSIFFLVILTTVITILLAILITFSIIRLSGSGNLKLGIFIASTCCLMITPPISGFCFIILRKLHQSRNRLNAANQELEEALSQVRILSGLLPICSKCKKIRDSEGYWKRIESYFEEHSDILFTHGLCEHCLNDLYGDKPWFQKKFNQDKGI